MAAPRAFARCDGRRRLGLSHLSDVFVLSREHGAAKPDPVLIQRACDESSARVLASAAVHGWLYDTFESSIWVKALLRPHLAGHAGRRLRALRVGAEVGRENRWTTQDIFALTILSVLFRWSGTPS